MQKITAEVLLQHCEMAEAQLREMKAAAEDACGILISFQEEQVRQLRGAYQELLGSRTEEQPIAA